MKIETKTTASFGIRASSPTAFDTALNLTSFACKRSNVEYYRGPAIAANGAAPDDRQCEVRLTCEDADYLVKLLNDLKAAYQLMDVLVLQAPDEVS